MTMVAVVVLLLNDHLLKQAHPGFVTGKLSDVAGLVVAPPLLALLFLGRADLPATLLTGALFTLVKTAETGAEAASHLWTLVAGPSRVLADPTDLLALPALALAWWVRRRSLETDAPRWRLLVVGPPALLAVVATSAAPPTSPVAHAVYVDGPRIVVTTGETTALASEDGGVTWSDRRPARNRPPQTAACVPGLPERCYRVIGGPAVAESDDGGKTWRWSWKVSERGRDRRARQYPGDDPADLRARSLAVQVRPGGHLVVVANGSGGILVREVSGEWRLLGWPDMSAAAPVDPPGTDRSGRPPETAGEPLETDRPGEPLETERTVALVLAVSVLLGAFGAGLRRLHTAYTISAVLASGGLLYVLLEGLDDRLLFVGGSVGLLATLACVVLAAAGGVRGGAALVGLGSAPLVYGAVYLPFLGWVWGVPDSYGVALAAAVVMTLAVVGAGAALLRRDARRALGGPDYSGGPDYLGGSSTSRPT
ncbi:WD40/YVTN/BNR-like repeat-containing protein [Nonomuraea lactucae]|uniref:WD40/YVTN/BNR-like repeat-containing protein n=1 Tax=Nonomuraea lactucae TaxID=2249762 RepID=UPI000DE53DB5|nr:hypothetical protein [Nonomuraea lactucae]